jgi:hypothetical protein
MWCSSNGKDSRIPSELDYYDYTEEYTKPLKKKNKKFKDEEDYEDDFEDEDGGAFSE